MDEENRDRTPPIPVNLQAVLTDLQHMALRRIEGLGWDLRFVREQQSDSPVPVVSDASGKSIGVLEPDGRINLQHNLRIRP